MPARYLWTARRESMELWLNPDTQYGKFRARANAKKWPETRRFRPSSTEGLHVWETSGQKPIPEPGKVREERMLQRNITPAK
jgi:hypothetical protein